MMKFVWFLLMVATCATSYASDYYLDPLKGDTKTGDGSQTKPWGSLQSVTEAKYINGDTSKIKSGDTLLLMNGHHGDVMFVVHNGKYVNAKTITVTAAPKQVPIIHQLDVRDASKWIFHGITFQPSPAVVDMSSLRLVSLTTSSDIVIDGCKFQAADNIETYTPEDWKTKVPYMGLSFNVTNITISNNVLRNLHFGISSFGDHVNIVQNRFDYLANDNIDNTASDCVIRSNVIVNHYGLNDWDTHHNDAIQMWGLPGQVMKNVLIERNYIVSTDGKRGLPVAYNGVGAQCMQGIGIYDGDSENLTIRNNVVMVPAYNGICILGTKGISIVGNTVLSQCSNPEVITWINVTSKKATQGGQPPSNVLVRDNIATQLELYAGQVAGKRVVTDDHNISLTLKPRPAWSNVPSNTVSSPDKLFIKYQPATATFDLHLLATSPASGTGVMCNLLGDDKDGKKRNQMNMDIGAYSR